jgi:hypothetical protein
MTHLRTHRRIGAAIAVALTALVLAACGSSSSTSSSSSGSSSSAAATGSGAAGTTRTKLTACLKAHGVTLPTRRTGTRPAGGYGGYGGGGGFFFGGGGAGASRFANPKFQAAFKACGGAASFRPGNFARRAALSHTAVTAFVACVDKHGYKMPAPNFSGKGPIFPKTVESNAKFQAASKACASTLRPAAAAGGAGGPGNTATTGSGT